VEIARRGFVDGSVERMAALRDRLEGTILETTDQVSLNSACAPRVPNTANIVFDCLEGEAMVIALDLKGLSVSTGAACSSGAIEPSHVLTAMGLPPDRARASIRFSLGKQNTAGDIDFALELIPEVVTRLRDLSPVYKKAVSSQA
jgi:cysteine desulfurase